MNPAHSGERLTHMFHSVFLENLGSFAVKINKGPYEILSRLVVCLFVA